MRRIVCKRRPRVWRKNVAIEVADWVIDVLLLMLLLFNDDDEGEDAGIDEDEDGF